MLNTLMDKVASRLKKIAIMGGGGVAGAGAAAAARMPKPTTPTPVKPKKPDATRFIGELPQGGGPPGRGM